LTGSPRWSPDGKRIIFESRRDGRGQLFLIPATGGAARQLTNEPWNHILPSWTHDGQSIYFASDRSGQWQVWRMSSEGNGAQQITRGGGFAAFEAWDERTIYYSRQSGGIWKVAREGGAETLVTDELAPNFWGQFALSERALYYAVFSSQQARAIRRLDLATGEIRNAVPLTRMPVQWDSGMAVSRDESFISWSQLDLGSSDIYVIDGFR
jgi:Tol biopolymer transport system component